MSKLNVVNYIYDRYNERRVISFKKRVTKILKDKGVTGEVICLNAYMKRDSGYGQYKQIAVIEINNITHTLSIHTTDSIAWDDYTDTQKEKRDLFEYVIEDYNFTLI